MVGSTDIKAFSDADWGRYKSDRKSVSGIMLFMQGIPFTGHQKSKDVWHFLQPQQHRNL